MLAAWILEAAAHFASLTLVEDFRKVPEMVRNRTMSGPPAQVELEQKQMRWERASTELEALRAKSTDTSD